MGRFVFFRRIFILKLVVLNLAMSYLSELSLFGSWKFSEIEKSYSPQAHNRLKSFFPTNIKIQSVDETHGELTMKFPGRKPVVYPFSMGADQAKTPPKRENSNKPVTTPVVQYSIKDGVLEVHVSETRKTKKEKGSKTQQTDYLIRPAAGNREGQLLFTVIRKDLPKDHPQRIIKAYYKPVNR